MLTFDGGSIGRRSISASRPHRGRPDDRVPEPHVPHVRDRRSGTRTSASSSTTAASARSGSPRSGCATSAPGAADVRVSEIVKMPTDLLAHGRRRVAGPPARAAHEPGAGDPGAAPQRSGALDGALVRAADRPQLRDRGRGPALAVPAATPSSTGCSATTGPVIATSSEHLLGRAAGPRRRPRSTRTSTTAWVTPFSEVDRAVRRRRRSPNRSRSTAWTCSWWRTGATRCRRGSRSRTSSGERREVEVPPVTRPARARTRSSPRRCQFPRDHGRSTSGSRCSRSARSRRASGTASATSRCRSGSPSSAWPVSRRCACPSRSPTECRDDLITIDDRPVPVRDRRQHRGGARARSRSPSSAATARRAIVSDARRGQPRAADQAAAIASASTSTGSRSRRGPGERRGRRSTPTAGSPVTTARRSSPPRRAVGDPGARRWWSRVGRRRRCGSPARPSRSGSCSGRATTPDGGPPRTASELGESTLADGYGERLARASGSGSAGRSR